MAGRAVRINQYFPKLCPPTCGMEINFKRIKSNPLITVLHHGEVTEITGARQAPTQSRSPSSPRYVNENCTACGKCGEVCRTNIPNPFNYGMDRIKAAYLPHEMAFPMRYVLAPEIIRTDDGTRCQEACAYDAIDLSYGSPDLSNSRLRRSLWRRAGSRMMPPGSIILGSAR